MENMNAPLRSEKLLPRCVHTLIHLEDGSTDATIAWEWDSELLVRPSERALYQREGGWPL